MPKRLMILLAVAALAIAACHNNSNNVTPSPSGTPFTPSPNPSIKKATVFVSRLGTPAPGVPVEESTPRSTSSPRPGTVIQTIYTGKKGMAFFAHLKPSSYYCWVAILGVGQRASLCASWAVWQTSIINLGP